MGEWVWLQPQAFAPSKPYPPFRCFLFYPLSLCLPSIPPPSISSPSLSLFLSHIQRFWEMLKLEASISAPALAPEAFKQKTEDESKTSLSNAHAPCTHTSTCVLFYFYSFLSTNMDNWTLTQPHLHTHEGRNVDKAGCSGSPPPGCLYQPPCQFLCDFLWQNVTLTSIYANEENRHWSGLAQYTYPSHLIIVIHCVKSLRFQIK